MAREEIKPLRFSDLGAFDRVLIGTPKWLYIADPAARWLNTVRGLEGKPVSALATFCGPPLQVFELDMLFLPLTAALRQRGALAGTPLAVSSNYHPYFFIGEMEALFRWLSWRAFGRPLHDFTLDGTIGQAEVQRFCDALAIGQFSPGA